jgi:transaldolase
LTSEITDRLALKFGLELAKIVPGRVSTQVDGDLSFDIEGTAAKARAIIAAYEKLGLSRERVLIKIAAAWEGIRAAEILQSEGIDSQAAACEAGVFLISPFVGRILDWYSKAESKSYTAETDPGVLSVRQIYNYYKAHGIATVGGKLLGFR